MKRREAIGKEESDVTFLHKTMRNLFPKKNNFGLIGDLEEVHSELVEFGIITKKETSLFLKRHRRWILEGEKSKLDKFHEKFYREELGEKQYSEAIRRQFWFAYPAMVRIALEREFGERYEAYSNIRDDI